MTHPPCRYRHLAPWFALSLLAVPQALAGCTADQGLPAPVATDLSIPSPADAATPLPEADLAEASDFSPPSICGPDDPRCAVVTYGPPFRLHADPNPDPLVRDEGVERTLDGALRLGNPPPASVVWIPNTRDLRDTGTVSRMDPRAVRETARYLTVTCASLKGGSSKACDGKSGCCALDSEARYQARRRNQPEPPYQTVQLTGNAPSRTTVAYNGDLTIANEAFGGQSSITRIAFSPDACVDRNGNGRIDTSSDVDGSGAIDVDCNGNGAPDDLADVKGTRCTNGKAQEFYGLDDECVLWTSNVFDAEASVRALATVPGSFGTPDLWVGSFARGTFRRIDTVTGKAVDEANLPNQCADLFAGPNGLAIDAAGIAWTPPFGVGRLCYFDTRNPLNHGVVRAPPWGVLEADGIAVDRQNNVWVGSPPMRYTPDRTNGVARLGDGYWTRFGQTRGSRMAVDSRSAKAYFTWVCVQGGVLRIPASTIPVLDEDQDVADPGWPKITMPCTGVAVDTSQNVWGIAQRVATRALVDVNGGIKQPVVSGVPAMGTRCPAGDSCGVEWSDAYSDMTPVGVGKEGRPAGRYDVLVRGCVDGAGQPTATAWHDLDWEADVPAGTTLRVQARAAHVGRFDDPAWEAAVWTTPTVDAPLALSGELTPNWHPGDPSVDDGWLWVRVLFRATTPGATPTLSKLTVRYHCGE